MKRSKNRRAKGQVRLDRFVQRVLPASQLSKRVFSDCRTRQPTIMGAIEAQSPIRSYDHGNFPFGGVLGIARNITNRFYLSVLAVVSLVCVTTVLRNNP